MADPLYDLLRPHLSTDTTTTHSTTSASPSPEISRYLSRLVSLCLDDLTTTEPQSLAQAAQSNLVSIQALSSRSHRTTTTSSDHLSTLRSSLPQLASSVEAIRQSIPALDSKAVDFASSYNRSKDDPSAGNALLNTRRESALLARQADKVQDILELPSLLSAAIASAASGTTGSTSSSGAANYTHALDLFAHIKRLQILYPDSQLVKSVLVDAEAAMKDMTANLISSLRGQTIRLAAAIRMIGWLRRVAPELATPTAIRDSRDSRARPIKHPASSATTTSLSTQQEDEGHFGALFLCARLCTFLYMTEALSPLRDLADQETQMRKSKQDESTNALKPTTTPPSTATAASRPVPTRTTSNGAPGTGYSPLHGQHTERYLKRYIEIFREQSFATVSMCRNIFSHDESEAQPGSAKGVGTQHHPYKTRSDSHPQALDSPSLSLTLPPALQSFPLHLVEVLTATLKEYLPNVTDPAARESLLMQVLYAANSLGRLGADFSLMIALLEEDGNEEEDVEENEEEESAAVPAANPEGMNDQTVATASTTGPETTALGVNGEDDDGEVHTHADETEPAVSTPPPSHTDTDADGRQAETDGAVSIASAEKGKLSEPEPAPAPEPEWVAVIKKHRVQAARLEALAAGQDNKSVHRRESTDIAVR